MGRTMEGGTTGYGTVFAINTDGTGFTNLHNFTASLFHELYQQRRSLSVGQIDSIGQHPVWDGIGRRQFGQWHGVRHQHQRHGVYEPA